MPLSTPKMKKNWIDRMEYWLSDYCSSNYLVFADPNDAHVFARFQSEADAVLFKMHFS